jgi:hypothetical protein
MRCRQSAPLRYIVAGLLLGGCIAASPDDAESCSDDLECETAFGGGSVCEDDGYCSEADECEVDEDCLIRFGDEWSCVIEAKACFVGGNAPDRGKSQTKSESNPTDLKERAR